MSPSLVAQVEGVLFVKATPLKISFLSDFFGVAEQDIQTALHTLHEELSTRGIRLMRTETEVGLVTAPELSDTIKRLREDDLHREIGKAGAETLAIILYRGPLSRTEIDRIRGVNSAFILRNLLVRGLIEKQHSQDDPRSLLYAATLELLAHLGITKREEAPQFEEVMNALDTFEEGQKEMAAGEAPFVIQSS